MLEDVSHEKDTKPFPRDWIYYGIEHSKDGYQQAEKIAQRWHHEELEFLQNWQKNKKTGPKSL